MINISANKSVDIVLSGANKALAEVVKSATPKELSALSQKFLPDVSQSKDLKSIVSSLLKQTATSSASDKELLNLVKNNPTLKNLGPIADTIKDLLSALKSDKTPLPIENKLKSFLVDVKDLTQLILKEKVANSGVFLESKLKNAQNPQVELKTVLESLTKTLDKSQIFNIRVLSEKLKEVLNSKVIAESSNKALERTPVDEKKALVEVVKKLETILPKLQEHLKSADAINSPKFAAALSKLEGLVEPKTSNAQSVKAPNLKEALAQVNLQLSQSANPQAKSAFEALEKIFTLLKTETSTQSETDKKIPKEIKANVESLKNAILKSDPVFSKEVVSSATKLASLSALTRLSSDNNVKEIISNDLKAVLSQASEEIVKSDHPNKTELLKHIDKLALQIDYSQLLSHLSNSSSLYAPFAWERMKKGRINIRSDKEEKFYVDIDLTLEDYGELNLKLALYDENQLNIQIYANSEALRTLVKENVSTLRSALIENEITPREIRIFDAIRSKPTSPYESPQTNINIGFEVKA